MRSKPIRYYLKKLINEEIEKFLIEVYDNPIETEYSVIKNVKGRFNHDIHRIILNSGNSYDVDFYKVLERASDILFIEDSIHNYVKSPILTIIEIGFTPTDVKKIHVDDDIIGTMEDPYIQKTNNFEQYELLGKVMFCIKEFVRKNPKYKIYSVGKNTHDRNLNLYHKIFDKLFAGDFKRFEGYSNSYYDEAFFYIKK